MDKGADPTALAKIVADLLGIVPRAEPDSPPARPKVFNLESTVPYSVTLESNAPGYCERRRKVREKFGTRAEDRWILSSEQFEQFLLLVEEEPQRKG